MKIYRIAEMNIAVKAKYEDTYRYMQDFLTDSQDYELYIEPTDEMIRYEAELGEEIHGDAGSPYICEAVAILRVICDYIIDKGGFFLHCSCLKYKDEAIIFTAPSGTGKSTHSALWRRHFGDDVVMINDDKPLVREKDGRFYIYGTPWNGKHSIGNNTSAPIRSVVFLSQAPENKATPISPIDAMALLLQQTVLPSNKTALSKLLDMLGRLVENIPMYRLGCTISDEAVTTIYQEIYG
ncbi:MAG: hypothetical protein II163_02680 [Ruminococcus sp.]|nr:hypothetical protein [Ruminococcus sp.]MBQ1898057.1 hypothetical protein [Ruminococcus sp.]